LEKDHDTIHHVMDRMAGAANDFMIIDVANTDRLRFVGDDFVDAAERLVRYLGRHLDDEEDLIIPLILDRGEGKLGL
jgi:hypothetical protein